MIQPALKKSALLISVFFLCMVIVVAGAWSIKKNTKSIPPAQPDQIQKTAAAPQPRQIKPVFLRKESTPNTYTLHLDSQGEAFSAVSIRLKANSQSTQKMEVSLTNTFSQNGWQTILNNSQKLTNDTYSAAFEVAFLTLEPLGGTVFSPQDTLAELTFSATDFTIDEQASTATTREGKEFGLQLQLQ